MPINIEATLDRNKINKEQDYEGHLMISLNSPKEDFDRTPVQVIVVADTSGSMGWRANELSSLTKMDVVKDTLNKIVDNLTDQDKLAIISFSTGTSVVSPLQSGGSKDPVKAAIAGLSPRGNTNLSGGILEGLRQIDHSFEGTTRLFVLTDGCPTSGITDPEELLALCRERDSKDAISFFGFGIDCDRDLLDQMSKITLGNFHFIEKPDEVRNTFARELGGLVSCRAQNINVRIKPNKGNEIEEILNDFDVEQDGDWVVVKAMDLYCGEHKYIVAKMKLPKVDDPKDRPFSVAKVEVLFDSLETKSLEEVKLNPKVRLVDPNDADPDPLLDVAEQVALLELAKKQLEAVEKANRGDFDGAKAVIQNGVSEIEGLVDRGSVMMSGLKRGFSDLSSKFDQRNYTSQVSSYYTNTASNMRRSRTSAAGWANSVYEIGAQADMVKAFNEPQEAKPATEGKKDTTTEKSSGITKKRKLQ